MADVLGSMHERYIFPQRVKTLAAHLAPLFPDTARVLDIGCGDGTLSRAILERRRDLHIEGVEVLPRGNPTIAVTQYDGENIPFVDNSFDAVLFVDVLHHAA